MPKLKFITMCGIVRSLKSTHTESFIFDLDLHRKFLFLLSGREIYFLVLDWNVPLSFDCFANLTVLQILTVLQFLFIVLKIPLFLTPILTL